MQLFVNDLTVIDFSYLCKQRGIVGESWIVDVLLDGDLNEQSMVLDFAIVKKQIKAIIDDAVDHKLLLPNKEGALRVTDSIDNDGHEYVDFAAVVGSYYLQSPKCAFAKIDSEAITIEAVTAHLQTIIKQQLPGNIQGLTLNLRPEKIDGFYYHYTHGLKKHDGNCQRIAHGHRSKIQLYKNDMRSISLEKNWCKRWQDIYLASEEDRSSFEQIQLSAVAKEKLAEAKATQKASGEKVSGHQYFAYHAPQGRFDIAVPENILEVVDCDSTVELLADYIARQLKKTSPGDNFKVVAYEGVAKGAIANV
ncbi:6-carboxytetrahydropterin synthase [Thalassomonas viridans]|uniref:6-carboxy-5,6,7,8-tetrahydropterin synthase n=1 Tax=Thalassomonas viridans TaxID=137584 RepID=A0AAE9ZAM4_9GAMM|nr:6-carboxytetrahydropterin synthase [Thalassomonas viridans]WDE07982.1 6-carboxytetrahydropterin synthase [Thalassomonas viridans]